MGPGSGRRRKCNASQKKMECYFRKELKKLKENNCQFRLQLPITISFKNESEINTFGQTELRMCYQHIQLKGALQKKKDDPRWKLKGRNEEQQKW